MFLVFSRLGSGNSQGVVKVKVFTLLVLKQATGEHIECSKSWILFVKFELNMFIGDRKLGYNFYINF